MKTMKGDDPHTPAVTGLSTTMASAPVAGATMVSIEDRLAAYCAEEAASVAHTDWAALARIVETFLAARKRGATIFTVGNGGSLATASHMANDFTKGCRAHNRTGFAIECLGDAVAVLTCLANDFAYDQVFSIPLRTKARPGDVLVYFSGSGNSPNLVEAALAARDLGVTTVGFLGRDGGALKGLSDLYVIAPSDSMEQIEDMHMMYEHNMVCTIRSVLEDEWGIEILRHPRSQFRCALFDFDGTLSLIRQGWQEIMIPYFAEVLRAAPDAESPEEVDAIVTEFVDKLTGKQTIFQCIQLRDEVVRRGGENTDPALYKAEYLRRLNVHIADRVQALRNGDDPEKYLVPGSAAFLELLRASGYDLYLASGTDEADVREEARLLGLDRWFGERSYGARDNMTTCSKQAVIEQIVADNDLAGSDLVGFGDGFVEIELVSGMGGYAVGVATDEVRRMGINQHKRTRLLAAGAAAIIPDFADAGRLSAFLAGEFVR